MKIKLQCQTGGYKYGDIVDVEQSKTISEEIATGLIKDGFAVSIEQATPVDESNSNPDADGLPALEDMAWNDLQAEAKDRGLDITGKKKAQVIEMLAEARAEA